MSRELARDPGDHEKAIHIGSLSVATFGELDDWFRQCANSIRKLDRQAQSVLSYDLMQEMQLYHAALLEKRGEYDGEASYPFTHNGEKRR